MAVQVPQSILSLLEAEEGRRDEIYPDTEDVLTGGIGHQLTAKDRLEYKQGDKVSDEQINEWFKKDSSDAYLAALSQMRKLGLDPQRNRDFVSRLTSVNFQLGSNWWNEQSNPRAFKDTWRALQLGDYRDASREVLDSEWARSQTPERAGKFANAILALDPIGKPTPEVEPEYNKPAKAPSSIMGLLMEQEDQVRNIDLSPQPREKFAPEGFAETFGTAVRGGAVRARADFQAFKGIFNTLLERDEAAETNLQRYRGLSEQADEFMSTMQPFEEFLEQPDFSSFLLQIAKGLGSVTPQAVTTIVSAFGTGGLSLLGRAGYVGLTSKAAIKQLYKELVEKAKTEGREALSPDEKAVLDETYAYGKYFKGGALTGAFAQEYVVGSAQSLGEYDESNLEIGKEEAAMASLLGIPQAVLGTISEAYFARSLFKLAIRKSPLEQLRQKADKYGFSSLNKTEKTRLTQYRNYLKGIATPRVESILRNYNAQKAGNTFVNLARDIATATGANAISEGSTELLQEGLQVAQRFAIDDEYDTAQAKLRLAEASFVGFFAGGARAAPTTAVSRIFSAVRDVVDEGFEARAEKQEADQNIGDPASDFKGESISDLQGQVDAALDKSVGKDTVFIRKEDESKIKDLKNLEQFSAQVRTPRGTIFTSNEAKAKLIVEQGATEKNLQTVLGYSDLMNQGFHDRVLEVRDDQGRVVHQETTNEASYNKALENAESLFGSFSENNPYTVGQRSIREVLGDRDRSLEDDFVPFDVDPDTGEQIDVEEREVGTQTQDVDVEAVDISTNIEEDGFKLSGRATDEEKAAYLDALDESERAFWETPNFQMQEVPLRDADGVPIVDEDGTPSVTTRRVGVKPVDRLSSSLIKNFLKARRDNPTRNVFIQLSGDRGLIVSETNPDSRGAVPLEQRFNEVFVEALEQGETAQATPNWGVFRTEQESSLNERKYANKSAGTILPVNMRTLIDFVRGDPDLNPDGTFDDANLAAGFVDLFPLLAQAGYTLTLNRVPVVRKDENGKNIVTPDLFDTPVYAERGGKLLTLNELSQRKGARRDRDTGALETPIQRNQRGRLIPNDRGTFVPYTSLELRFLNLKDEVTRLKERLLGESRAAVDKTYYNPDGTFNATDFGSKFIEFTSQSDRLNRIAARRFDTKVDDNLATRKENLSEEAAAERRARDVQEEPTTVTPQEIEQRIEVLQAEKTVLENILEEEYTVDSSELQADTLFPDETSRIQGRPVDRPEGVSGFDDTIPSTRQEIEEGDGWFEPGRQSRSPTDRQAEARKESRKAGETLDRQDKAPGPQKITTTDASGKVLKPLLFTQAVNDLLSIDGIDITSTFAKLTNFLQDSLKLNYTIYVATADDVRNNRANLTFSNPQRMEQIKSDVTSEAFLNRNRAKVYMQVDRDGNKTAFIVLNDIDPRDGRVASAMPDLTVASKLNFFGSLGHELGHIFFFENIQLVRENLSNPDVFTKGIFKNMFEAFQRDRNKIPNELRDSHQYWAEGAIEKQFEEWFADQFASYLLNPDKKATTGVESYFKRIAKKLIDFIQTNFLNILTTRQGLNIEQGTINTNPAFRDYIEDTIEAYRLGLAQQQNLRVGTKTLFEVRDMLDTTMKGFDSLVGKQNATDAKKLIRDIFTKVTESDSFRLANKTLKYWVAPVDNFLYTLGPEGEAIAKIFYSRSQSAMRLGMLQGRQFVINQRLNQFYEIFNFENPNRGPTEEEIDSMNTILLEAESEAVTVSPQAEQVRQWFRDFYDNYISKVPGNRIKKFEKFNFFSRQLNLTEIANNDNLRARLIEIVEANNANVNKTEATAYVSTLLREETYDPDEDISESDLLEKEVVGMAKQRSEYLKDVSNQELRGTNPDEDLLINPHLAVRKYIENVVKKSEYRRRAAVGMRASDVRNVEGLEQFKDIEAGQTVRGHLAVEVLLRRIKNTKDREKARKGVEALLGKAGRDMPSFYKSTNSLLLTTNILTYLTFAAVASIPDLAGPFLRSRDATAFGTAISQLKFYFNNRKDMEKFARDVGVITFDSVNTMYINAAELSFMGEKAKYINEQFFRYTGTEAFTKFTRVFALGMGEQFLKREAAKNTEFATKNLRQLGVTRDDIEAFFKNEKQFDTGNAEYDAKANRVRQALARFVDESIIRPNAAERPVWASNPYFALVWQLKSFFYAYGKNVIGGVMRQTGDRYSANGSLPSAAIPILLAAATLLPLTMVGLEFRELIKYLTSPLTSIVDFGAGDDPALAFDASKFRTNSMDWGEYTMEIIDRSGALGAWAMMLPVLQADNYGDEYWISPLGPTATRFEDWAKGRFNFTDILPFAASLD